MKKDSKQDWMEDHPKSIVTEDDYAKFGRANPITRYSGHMSTPSAYLIPSDSAYPGNPDVDMKFKGWVAIFGEHFLCEVGCKRFADKSLDKVLKFIEKEIRHFYEPRQIKKKGSGIEVKSYVRKERKKKVSNDMAIGLKLGLELQREEKEIRKKIDTSKHSKIFDEVDKEQVLVDVEKGKVLFVKDENIKVKDG